MIVNAMASPFAVERRNKVKANLFFEDGTNLLSLTGEKMVEISLVQEFCKNQTSIPRSEVNITIDNRDRFFDISVPESAVHSLKPKCCCNVFFSSVENGSSDSFIQKGKYFFNDFADAGKNAILKFTDPASHFVNNDMDDVFRLESTSGSERADELFRRIVLLTEYDVSYNVPEEISTLRTHTKGSFRISSSDDGDVYMTIKEGFVKMAKDLTKTNGSPIYFIIDDEGVLKLKKQQTEVSATITKKHFFDYEILQGEDCLISKIADRGNILYQLGDIVEVVDGSKTFKTEIYKIHYRYSRGCLSSEWEGVIL